jgi:predicted deacylase
MICIRGGDGPTALLTAGTHGDEYEGQIALLALVRVLQQAHEEGRIAGRIIILPSLNRPAVLAARRNSPLDGGNLNRVFPGKADGGPTEMIAHYVTSVLFPMSDIVIDLHSGGSSLEYLPIALARPGYDANASAAIRTLLESFGAPVSVITTGSGGGANSTLYAAAEAVGIPALTTELGGGPTLTLPGLGIAENGLRRVLDDYGIVTGLNVKPVTPTRLMRALGPAKSIFAPHDGLFVPHADIGDDVTEGELAGQIYRLDDPLCDPTPLHFAVAGEVIWRRFPTMTQAGDALYGLMVPYSC